MNRLSKAVAVVLAGAAFAAGCSGSDTEESKTPLTLPEQVVPQGGAPRIVPFFKPTVTEQQAKDFIGMGVFLAAPQTRSMTMALDWPQHRLEMLRPEPFPVNERQELIEGVNGTACSARCAPSLTRPNPVTEVERYPSALVEQGLR